MPLETPSRGRRVQHDQHWNDVAIASSEPVSRDLRRQSNLRVELATSLLGRCDLRLDLDDKQHGEVGPLADDVDRTALGEMAVRDFDVRAPPSRVRNSDDLDDDKGVRFIEQTVDGAASPSDLAVKGGAQHSCDPTNRPKRQELQPAQLSQRNELLAQTGLRAAVDLAETEPQVQRPKDQPDSAIVHAAESGDARLFRAYLWTNSGFCSPAGCELPPAAVARSRRQRPLSHNAI